jgi:hypothetical protein
MPRPNNRPEDWEHQGRAAEELARGAPITEDDASGLIYLLAEILFSGRGFGWLVDQLCYVADEGMTGFDVVPVPYCQDWDRDRTE